jgi:hypothetical protein
MQLFKKIIWGILILGALIFAFLMFGSYGDGYRAGNLTKVATKGIIFKTHEGEMYIGTETNSETAESNGVLNKTWYFSIVNDAELIDKLNTALFNGHRVKLHYKQKFWKLFWVGDSKYVVDGVEILDNSIPSN